MVNQTEHAAELRALRAQNDKAHDEQMAAFKVLEDALAAGGNTTPEVDEAMVGMRESIQRDDDVNPDAPQP